MTAVLLTVYTAAQIHLTTHLAPTTTPLEMVKSSTAMTGAAKKTKQDVMDNVFLMKLECQLDTDPLLPLMALRYVVRDKTAVMLGKPTSNISHKACHSVAP